MIRNFRPTLLYSPSFPPSLPLHLNWPLKKKKFIVLGLYFYVFGISYDKMHFTYIWVNLSRIKMIITSGYIKDMKKTQELLKKS